MKKLLLAVAISFLFLFTPTAAAQQDKCKPMPKQFSDAATTWYLKYNADYFGGKLPTDTEVVACEQNIILPGALGATIPPHDGKPFRIEISYAYNLAARQMQLTLLHEMAHIKVYENDSTYKGEHDGRFQHEMRILALEGAFDDLW